MQDSMPDDVRAARWRRRLAEFWAMESAHGLARALARRGQGDDLAALAPVVDTGRETG
jgi:hypothetical protein